MSISSSMDVSASSGIFLICRSAALKKDPEEELGIEAITAVSSKSPKWYLGLGRLSLEAGFSQLGL